MTAVPDPRIERLEGRTLVLRGDDIDTDRIIPARFLKAVTFAGLESSVFADDRQEAAASGRVHPFDDPARAGARILLVNANFGCGSSREHAPQALYRWGLRAIVGASFAEIFFGNAVAIGLACVTVAPSELSRLMTEADRDAKVSGLVDLAGLTITVGEVRTAGLMPETARAALRTGTWDMTSLLLDRYDEVQAIEARLPYRRNFAAS